MKTIRFVDFCKSVLRLRLTSRQRVLVLVAIDGIDPVQLDQGDREIARELFGDLDHVPASARRIQAWRLGRGSGKTTMAAALAVFSAVTADLTRCGPGDEPAVVIVAPRLRTARLAVRIARAMVRATPALEHLVTRGEDTREGFAIQREHGRRVAIASFAASKGGAAARGLSIVAFVLDEAEFFASDDEFAVTDREVYQALIPRLVPGARGVLISTPWPVPTLMAELFERNFANPTTALAALGTTSSMRDFDPDLVAHVETERQRDPEMAAREFDCDASASGTTGFFDPSSVDAAISDDLLVPASLRDGETGHAAWDLGLSRDSAALAVVGRHEDRFRVVALNEMRPGKGHPLKLSSVIETFAGELASYRIRDVGADAWSREPSREWTDLHGISIEDAPSTREARNETFLAARVLLREGRLAIPRLPRLVAQLKSVVSKPVASGALQITIPRRSGLAHGDLVSALVLATWRAAEAPRDDLRGGGVVMRHDFDAMPLVSDWDLDLH